MSRFSIFGKSMRGLLLLTLIALFAATSTMFAQAPEGKIVGVVRDPSGAVVPNASVKVINEATSSLYSAQTGPDGGFIVPSLTAGSYRVEIEAKGFRHAVYTAVQVLPAREYSLTATLTLGEANEHVEVVAGQELVNTSSSELTKTITTEQVKELPLNGHDINGLIGMTAGANANSRAGGTTINGSRPSWTQVTVEGINIQDPFIRDNALDYLPNRPSTENVSEFSINTSTQGADSGAAASTSIRMVVPSGSNKFHGKVFEYNRNSALAANEWFNNHNRVEKPQLNRNDFGANIGGPILKDKLFFFGFYEGRRLRTMQQRDAIIPAYDDYLKGQFRYVRPSDKTVQSVNVIDMLPGLTLDPKIQQLLQGRVPSASNGNNYAVGNSKPGQLLNTIGMYQNQSANNNRDAFGFKVDYDLNAKNHINGVFQHMHEVTQRPSYDPVNIVPAITNDSKPQLFTAAWRYNATNNLINNVRFGANLVNAPFLSSYKNTEGYTVAASSTSSNTATVTGLGVVPTQVLFQPQGRDSRVWQFLDDATWVRGKHTVSFGAQYQTSRVRSYNYANNLYPQLSFGYSTLAPKSLQLTSGLFPGGSISSADLSAANALRAFLGGLISSAQQTFEVADKTSGFVPNLDNIRRYTYDDYSLYIQDKWRLASNFTVTAGLKWEYFTPLKEANGLLLGPVYSGTTSPVNDLLGSNVSIDFLKNGMSYNPDKKDFGPAIGFAWDPFKNGKTSIRGGYSMVFVNDNMITFAANAAATGNAGLESTVVQNPIYQTLASGIPTVQAPTFKVPRTYADQMALSTTGVVWALDPNVKTPKAHLVTFGFERELPKDSSISVFYVGSFGRKMLRGIDYNQNNAGTNAAYLADFNRARTNGYLAQAKNGTFDPTYNSTITGSQPLSYLPNLIGPYLTYSTTLTYLQQNQAAGLADWMVQNRGVFTDAPAAFLPNPNIFAIDYGKNGAESSYHSLQIEGRRRFKGGLSAQGSYVWGKLLTDELGTQTRFDPLLDNARPYLARARSEYDLRHSLKGNFVYELPFGRGKAFLGGATGVLDKLVGGWQMSSILQWQSGNPFSILSNRATFNRSSRTSSHQGAVSTLTPSEIKKLLGVYQAKDGTMYYINPMVLDPSTGRGVSPDNLGNTGSTSFSQVFFNPTAGNIGNLGLMSFDAPSYSDVDLSIQKRTKINERFTATFRAEAFNLLNHASFYYTDDEINSTSFGKIAYTSSNARQMQLSLRIEF